MRLREWFVVLAVVTLFALTGCTSAQPAAPARADLRLFDTDGAPHDLDAALARGEAVALVFWQTWCPSCAGEAPAIADAQRRYADRIHFVGVVPGRDADVDDGEVARVRAAWGYEFPQVRDRDLSLARRFEVKGTPTIVVLGAGGAVTYSGHRPPEDWAPLAGAPFACEGGVCPLPAAAEEEEEKP